MKFIIIFFFAYSLSYSSMMLGKKNFCIEDYFVDNGTLYYLKSDGLDWKSTTSKTYTATIQNGWDYNTTNGNCYRKPQLVDLGIDYNTYNMLLAITAILFSSIVFFVIASTLVGL